MPLTGEYDGHYGDDCSWTCPVHRVPSAAERARRDELQWRLAALKERHCSKCGGPCSVHWWRDLTDEGPQGDKAAYRAADGAAKTGYDPLPAPLPDARRELRPDPVGSAETISEGMTGRVLRHVVTEHVYLSTGCLHGQHSRCRETCKFCETKCLCSCHCFRKNTELGPTCEAHGAEAGWPCGVAWRIEGEA